MGNGSASAFNPVVDGGAESRPRDGAARAGGRKGSGSRAGSPGSLRPGAAF